MRAIWTWIRTQALGGYEGWQFSKEPIVWLGALVVVGQIVLAIAAGEMTFWPDGITAIGTALGVLVARGNVVPKAKV